MDRNKCKVIIALPARSPANGLEIPTTPESEQLPARRMCWLTCRKEERTPAPYNWGFAHSCPMPSIHHHSTHFAGRFPNESHTPTIPERSSGTLSGCARSCKGCEIKAWLTAISSDLLNICPCLPLMLNILAKFLSEFGLRIGRRVVCHENFMLLIASQYYLFNSAPERRSYLHICKIRNPLFVHSNCFYENRWVKVESNSYLLYKGINKLLNHEKN